MSTKQVRDFDKFMLRFPDGMREQIADAAKKNARSMNAEIVDRLERSFRPENHAANVIEDLRVKLFEIEETLNRTLEKEAEVMIRREQNRK